jgi:hypothetical protein
MEDGMLTTQDIERASELIRQRKKIEHAEWTHVGTHHKMGQIYHEPFDDKLAFAVEEYRGRRLDAIDAELRELGVDPTSATKEEPSV